LSDLTIFPTLESDLKADLLALAKKHGLELSLLDRKVDPTAYRLKVVFNTTSIGPAPEIWYKQCRKLKFDPDNWGRTFRSYSGDKFRIVGIDDEDPFIFAVGVIDGDKKQFALDEVREFLKKQK